MYELFIRGIGLPIRGNYRPGRLQEAVIDMLDILSTKVLFIERTEELMTHDSNEQNNFIDPVIYLAWRLRASVIWSGINSSIVYETLESRLSETLNIGLLYSSNES